MFMENNIVVYENDNEVFKGLLLTSNIFESIDSVKIFEEFISNTYMKSVTEFNQIPAYAEILEEVRTYHAMAVDDIAVNEMIENHVCDNCTIQHKCDDKTDCIDQYAYNVNYELGAEGCLEQEDFIACYLNDKLNSYSCNDIDLFENEKFLGIDDYGVYESTRIYLEQVNKTASLYFNDCQTVLIPFFMKHGVCRCSGDVMMFKEEYQHENDVKMIGGQ